MGYTLLVHPILTNRFSFDTLDECRFAIDDHYAYISFLHLNMHLGKLWRISRNRVQSMNLADLKAAVAESPMCTARLSDFNWTEIAHCHTTSMTETHNIYEQYLLVNNALRLALFIWLSVAAIFSSARFMRWLCCLYSIRLYTLT